MGTELPAERLHRRLGGEAEADANSDGDEGNTDAALSRWLPEAKTGDTSGWLAAVRADPGRAGAIALGIVGLVAVLVTVFSLDAGQNPAGGVGQIATGRDGFIGSPHSRRTRTGRAGHRERGRPGAQAGPGDVGLGARIADALTAAGGALDGADLMGLNMARRVGDGEQIIVGIAAPPGEPTTIGQFGGIRAELGRTSA